MSSASIDELALVIPSGRKEGGGDVWLDHLLRYLGPTTSPLIIFENDGILAASAIAYGCNTCVLPSGRGATSAPDDVIERELSDALRHYEPRKIVFWTPRAQIHGSRARALAATRSRTAWVQHVMPSRFWMHEAAAQAPSDAVFCVSTAVANAQKKLHPSLNIRVVHPGIEPYSPTLCREATRRSLGLDRRTLVIGVTGRLEPWKGQDIALRMVAFLRESGIQARLLLIGKTTSAAWPEYHAQILCLISELKLNEDVELLDHRTDVQELLPALDILVCASREEGFGLAILEGMDARLPVVATRCGGPEDIIINGSNGLLVDSEDPRGMAEVVKKLIKAPALRAEIGERGHQDVITSFTARLSAQSFIRAVDETLS